MQKFVMLAAAILTVSMAMPFEVYEDENGQEYLLVPSVLHRERRQTSVDVNKSGPGTRVTLGHQGTLFNNGIHRLDGGASVSKQFKPSGPTIAGGNLGYSHIPSGSGLNVGAQHGSRGMGTNFNAQGTANIWHRGNSRLDAVGSYQRQFGGAGGTGRPNYYGGLNFNHRF